MGPERWFIGPLTLTGLAQDGFPLDDLILWYFKKMDLESSVFLFPGRTCYRPVGERTSWHRVNGLSDVGYQSGVVVGVFLQRKLFKSWSISVNLVSSRFLKRMSGLQVLQDCELVTLMKHLWENTASGWDSNKIAINRRYFGLKNHSNPNKEKSWYLEIQSKNIYLILNCTCNKLQLTAFQ